MKKTSTRLAIIDDDAAVRSSLELLMNEAELPFLAFPSAREFLDKADLEEVGCIVVNERMPGMSGSELQRRLSERQVPMPLVFVTGDADVSFVVRVVRAGAFDVIEKPFREDDLLETVRRALDHFGKMARVRQEKAVVQERLERLTRRELEVLDLMVAGKKNKDIARELDISPKTLDIHRGKVMEKMEARTVADVVRWRIFSQSPDAHWPEGVGFV